MELNCVTNLDTHAVEEGAAVSTLDKAADDGANAETGDTAVRMSALPADRGISSLPESPETMRSGIAMATGATASTAVEPVSMHPLEAHLNALPRAPLMAFDATGRMAAAIPFAFDDYLELVDTTGRVIREDKRGYIPGETPKILERLNIDPEQFIATAARMLQQFSTAIGTPEHLTAHCVARNVAFLRGMGTARALFVRKAA